MRMTKQRIEILKDLEGGARVILTYDNIRGTHGYTLESSRKHKQPVIDLFIPELRKAGRLKELDDGLFKGCSQSFVLVQ